MEQQAIVWAPTPLSGNNPIVTVLIDAYAPIEKVFTVTVKNIGGAIGIFHVRLVGVFKDGSSRDTALPGFGANATTSADFSLEPGESKNVSFAYERDTGEFDEYTLLSYIEENDGGAYVVRRIGSTLLHFR